MIDVVMDAVEEGDAEELPEGSAVSVDGRAGQVHSL